MDASEIEFLSEEEMVSIIPSFNCGVLNLISRPIGPFRAGLPTTVPIWVALILKQQQKCRILEQEWMNINNLKSIKEDEKSSNSFTQMPSNHYMEQAQILLGSFNDDIPDADNLRTAVKDIWDLRMAKLRTSVHTFITREGQHARLDNLTTMEVNSVRPLLPHALDQSLRIQQKPK
ncbi:probable DNA replication complex GINS protein PSF2 [Leptopilina boulardi]|uniref:probable DNA replication complex GINS protein PSF2 n=1 Tax=Leptopilina boulardi TaxID=63433 RepID=UPI0021F63E2A|nr:probable DNA replication complex GINS protein PSF2 [Leptopilina boulardi]